LPRFCPVRIDDALGAAADIVFVGDVAALEDAAGLLPADLHDDVFGGRVPFRTILAADDSKGILETLASLFGPPSYRVVNAPNGKDA